MGEETKERKPYTDRHGAPRCSTNACACCSVESSGTAPIVTNFYACSEMDFAVIDPDSICEPTVRQTQRERNKYRAALVAIRDRFEKRAISDASAGEAFQLADYVLFEVEEEAADVE